MPLRDAVIGDTVQFRDVSGNTRNATVLQTQPATPSAPAVSNQGAGGTLGAATYSYRVSQVVNGVESAASTAGTTVVGAGTTNQCTITLPGVAGVVYRVYGRTGASELLIATTAAGATEYIDTGAVTPAGALPTADGRVGLFAPTGGLTGGQLSTTTLKATTMKQTSRYYKR